MQGKFTKGQYMPGKFSMVGIFVGQIFKERNICRANFLRGEYLPGKFSKGEILAGQIF